MTTVNVAIGRHASFTERPQALHTTFTSTGTAESARLAHAVHLSQPGAVAAVIHEAATALK
jgi:hypothetical protein